MAACTSLPRYVTERAHAYDRFLQGGGQVVVLLAVLVVPDVTVLRVAKRSQNYRSGRDETQAAQASSMFSAMRASPSAFVAISRSCASGNTA